ncbi:germination-specific N-acetylmuramoyl-L-alanine amidase [Sporosarcina luteola]|uniref:Germination-specific N-acetylmuramoyl-L-alanine amidase n=1 Tax=Sporosarcina luteola TaxID=582850 RepID=A0A511ZCM7_9BACL|nr:N-acetylmuramoyl-L-alanine amidase [Sporosarcina luteola]GEN85199.1 germination-specific N-acetylmuramoyl-L-alanine amidase [Sporosarcina luteola]
MKRWLIIGLLFVTSLVVVIYGVNASDRGFFMPEQLGGVKIVIDPGHGGLDGGASFGDVVERDITLSIAHELKKKLEKKGAMVVMTREKDGDALAEHAPGDEFGTTRKRKLADLKLRESIAIEEDPDMFLSVHVNAIPETKWRGAQVFYHSEGHEGGELLAKSIQGSFRDNLQNTDREAMAIKGVYLLKKVPMPSVLIETGFISNPEERALLTDPNYQVKVADSIVEGIIQFHLSEEN